MDKELQDRAWQGLPQEARDFFLRCYNDENYSPNTAYHIAGMLDHVFGEHNLSTLQEETPRVEQVPIACINYGKGTGQCIKCGQLCYLEVFGYECTDYEEYNP